ncbi:MAG TPA: aldo/keto reductase [Burkholderiaceae bacterium]|nr:aldo/keto reductase [Burkholderiaceae bacterium]
MAAVDRNRRGLIAGGALAVVAALGTPTVARSSTVLQRPIPKSGEPLPLVGLGTWLTFDIGASRFDLARRRLVLEAFYAGGGRLIDSSPMYGRAEAVIGELTTQLGSRDTTFSATKVWTGGREAGMAQMTESLGLWRTHRFDLMQIHNMVDWETHLETLQRWKAEGRIRYIGITTSHGRRHAALEQALQRADFDFVQFTYSLADRSAESRLLPLAASRGVAVIANRPFDGGALVDRLSGTPLPAWAAEIDCVNWAQVCLKWIAAHPAVTCAIPATTNPDHMRENILAAHGRLPDSAMRRTIADHVARL